MRILVVGGTGFIGESLCEELDGRGHEVTALSRSPGDADLPAGVEEAIGDVTAYDSIFRPAGGDEAHFTVHRDGTENVVRAAEAHGVDRILQMSALGADPEGDTAYIRSKGLAESIVRDSALEWTTFRPSVVFGDGGEFIPYTKRLAPPYLTPLPGGGRTRFQPIWVSDLVPMLADALEGRTPDEGTAVEAELDEELTPAITPAGNDEAENPHVGQVYEIGGPTVLTLAEVAELAHAADNKPVDIVSIPMPLAKIGLSSLDYVPGSLLDALPGVPRMGSDQYRSLQFDNTTDDNDIDAFGLEVSDLRTVPEYLGVSPDELEA
ncbi:complex I NDUFA9 subunit family protein [Halobacteriales archaeon QS_1_68_44]|nr:MAG: complex I NDUFA9 subunit family protein [Halobacteriales archaeon QS_1_68_44]